MLARDALRNSPQTLLETGKPVAMKVARRVWEGAVGKGLASVSTSLAAYFIAISSNSWSLRHAAVERHSTSACPPCVH
jgi:hypothetical protein